MAKITIYNLAEKLDVSIATVSRAINPETRPKVAPDTLRKIDEAIRKSGYTPNIAAKNLSRSAFKSIGTLFPHHSGIFLESYYSNILCGVADALIDSDHHLKTVMLKCRDEKWDCYNFKLGEGIDGLIVTHWHAFFSKKNVLEKLGLPCVIISDPEKRVQAHFVSGDHFLGGKLAAQHLYSHGHRKVVILTGPADSTDSQLRVKGFKAFWTEFGLPIDPHLIVSGDFQEEKGAKAVETLFRGKKPEVTAIFSCNDNMAFGAIRKLKTLGLSCPKDISVVGYDNDGRCETFNPPLTTLKVPVYEIAKTAAEKLMKYLKYKNKKEFFYGHTLVPVSLVERSSVRRITS